MERCPFVNVIRPSTSNLFSFLADVSKKGGFGFPANVGLWFMLRWSTSRDPFPGLCLVEWDIDNCVPPGERIATQALFRIKRVEIQGFLHRTKDQDGTVSIDEFYQYYMSLQDTDSYVEVMEFVALVMATTDCQTPRISAEEIRRFLAHEFTPRELRSRMVNGLKIQNVGRLLSIAGSAQYHMYQITRFLYLGVCKAPGRSFRCVQNCMRSFIFKNDTT
jgi:hypothetical protein